MSRRRARTADRNRPSRRRGPSARTLLAVLAILVVLFASVVGIGWLTSRDDDGDGGHRAAPEPGAPVNPPGCVAVEVISVPGTWESSVTDDPLNPTQFPRSMLGNVTRPLAANHDSAQVKVWTAPYPAQLRNSNNPQDMSYEESVAAGHDVVDRELAATHAECPQTGFIIMGFSQGATIAGDVAADIGAGNGPVPADLVLGVATLADPRRSPGQGVMVGNPVGGVGVEVALGPFNNLVKPLGDGLSMRGPRPGYGTLQEKVMDICAIGDFFCDAPKDVLAALPRIGDYTANNSVHASYAVNPDVVPGTTALQWMAGWATNLIAAHSAGLAGAPTAAPAPAPVQPR